MFDTTEKRDRPLAFVFPIKKKIQTFPLLMAAQIGRWRKELF